MSGIRKIYLAVLLHRRCCEGGEGHPGPDVRPRPDPEPGVLPGQQGGQPHEPVHQRSGHRAGLLRLGHYDMEELLVQEKWVKL